MSEHRGKSISLGVSAIVAVALWSSASADAQIYNAADFEVWPFAADLNRDLDVGVLDLLMLLGAWGPCPPPCPPSCVGDTDGDCQVNVVDLLALLGAWGPVDLTGTQYGRALVFPEGPIDFTNWDGTDWPNREPVEVLLTDLGIYDSETGEYLESNDGLLTGKYLETDMSSIDEITLNEPFYSWPNIPNLYRPDNDFRVNYVGNAEVPQREAILWASQVHAYYFITESRRKFLNDAFIDSLNLPPEIAVNLKHRQFRPDLQLPNAIHEKPLVRVWEIAFLNLSYLFFPVENGYIFSARTRGPLEPYRSAAPVSFAFDAEALVGDYAGLVTFWVTATNEGFPPEGVFEGEWATNMLPAVNDGLSHRVAQQLHGNVEIGKYAGAIGREWGEILNFLSNCGGPDGYPCDKGLSVRNVMMFNETQTDLNGVFPYSYPSGFTTLDGPQQEDLASFYITAVLYDIAHEAGLGGYKTDQLIWKSISLINDMDYMPMRLWGQTMQQAARELWPDPDNPALSIYEEDIRQVLLSRGISVDDPIATVPVGTANFTQHLPPAIGPTLRLASFNSSHPNTQPSVGGYAAYTYFVDEYTFPGAPVDYVAYTFSKHSKYGPCDHIEFQLGGTYDGQGLPNGDGTVIWRGDDRFGQITVLVPGNLLRYKTFRQRCPTEAIGYYAEDVRPFGFRVLQATANGFSFTVQRTGEDEARITYQFSVVDPSLKVVGPASYDWTFTEFDGAQVQASGQVVTYAALRDQPFTIAIDRTRDAQVDNLTLRERGNDLDRNDGLAFVFDATSPSQPVECGTSGSGDCFVPDGSPGCEDSKCCAEVCLSDPYCCSVEWDATCSFLATAVCIACEATCPPESIAESEACGTNTNGGCDFLPNLYEPITCGETVCGTVWAADVLRDRYFYEFTVPSNGTQVTITVQAEFFASVWFNTTCLPGGGFTFAGPSGSGGCPLVVDQCLNAGTYRFVVQPVSDDGIYCGSGNAYVLTLTCQSPCN